MKKYKYTNFLIGVLFTLFFISLGVVVVINLRSLYYFDISHLDIVSESGLPREQIKENYDALIDWCSPFFRGELSFPSLIASEHGLQHFSEVKRIFVFFYYSLAFTSILCIYAIYYKIKHRDYGFLKTSGIVSLVLPTIVLLLCSINFEKTFELFHKLFFRNDYWLFDPKTDPVITILPETYFLHCALVIIGILLLGCMTLFLSYHFTKSKRSIKNRKLHGLNM